MFSQSVISQAAARGATKLDEMKPGWTNRVDERTLDMTSPERCVLGQVFGSYSYGLEQLGLRNRIAYGFDLNDLDFIFPFAWTRLRQAWKREIRARREAAVNAA